MSLIIDIVNSHISLLGHNFKWWGGWIPSHISENGQSYIYCDLAAYSGIMQQKLRGGGLRHFFLHYVHPVLCQFWLAQYIII